MNGFIAFTKKEFLEQLRTYKTLIMFAVFVIFGMMSPLLAKMMPDIFASLDMKGFEFTIPDPTYLDAYSQFFKNVTQMGIVVVLLVFSGSVSQEISKGTLVNMLSKGLPRSAVILSKYTACLILWTASFAVSAAVNYGYTLYLFGSHSAKYLFFSCLCFWLFGAFVLAVIFLTSTLTKGSYGGLLATAAVIGVLLLLGIFPGSAQVNPITLASSNAALLNGSASLSDITTAFWTTLAATAACLFASVLMFRKKQL